MPLGQDDRAKPPPPQSRPAETYGAGAGAPVALILGIYEAVVGHVANEAVVSALLFAAGAVPAFKTHQVRRARARDARGPDDAESKAEPSGNPYNPASVALNNPTETGSSVSGAVAAIVVAVLRIKNQAV